MVSLAIGMAVIMLLWMSKAILKGWFTQKEENLQIDFEKENLSNLKKIRKITDDFEEFEEINGPVVTLRELQKKLKGKNRKPTQTA